MSTRLRLPRTAIVLLSIGISNCGGGGASSQQPGPVPTPDFSISVSPNSLELAQGGSSGPATISITGSNGFNRAVSVTISGLPTGTITSPVSPLTVTPGSSLQFTISASSTSPTGDSTITLDASSGSLDHQASVTMTTNPPPQTFQSNGILYLESFSSGHIARVGLNTAWGGSIVEVSIDGTISSMRMTQGEKSSRHSMMEPNNTTIVPVVPGFGVGTRCWEETVMTMGAQS